MVLKILTNIKRSLDVCKVNVPLTDSIDFDVTIVEYSTPERTVNVARKNLREHTLFFSLVEYAVLFNYKAIVELNVLMSEYYYINDDHNKRNYKEESTNSPKFERRKNALSRYNMRSVNSHIKSPFRLIRATDITLHIYYIRIFHKCQE